MTLSPRKSDLAFNLEVITTLSNKVVFGPKRNKQKCDQYWI